MMMYETPEQKARHDIDVYLTAAGWIIQSRDELDLTAGRGVAIREFPMKPGFGFVDYVLYLDRKAVGAVEAKVRAQEPDPLPRHGGHRTGDPVLSMKCWFIYSDFGPDSNLQSLSAAGFRVRCITLVENHFLYARILGA
jgi:hypothetical protein